MPEGVLGYCCPATKTIATRKDLKGHELLSTVIHEIGHAIDFESGIFQTLDHTQLEILAECRSRVMLENFDIKPKKPKRKK